MGKSFRKPTSFDDSVISEKRIANRKLRRETKSILRNIDDYFDEDLNEEIEIDLPDLEDVMIDKKKPSVKIIKINKPLPVRNIKDPEEIKKLLAK